jgi:hypothetical protein
MTRVTDSISAEAERVRESLASQAKEIRESEDLTADGKERRIAEAHADATTRMDALKDKWREESKQSTSGAMRSAFGSGYSSGADAISIRDAEDRVAQLETASEARELFERAQRNGDTVLSRAIGLEAMRRSEGNFFNHHWKLLLNDYAEANPSTAGSIKELVNPSPEQGFQNAMTFMMPRASEL